MATHSTLQYFIVGEVVAVDVAAVERELTGLWKSAAESPDGDGAVMRACVLNLLVHAEDEKATERINNVISEVTDYHPCRAIVLIRRDSADPQAIAAWVSAHCRLPVAGGKQVCCEQISLAAGQSAFDELHGTVLPLLVTDLPVYLWWPGRADFSNHLFQSLLQSCDRVLVDSSGFLLPEKDLTSLAHFVDGQKDHTAVVDLAWSRSSLWRGLTAQFFDGSDFRPSVDMLGDVAIEYVMGNAPNPIQALLTCGWLISRLRWKLAKVTAVGVGAYTIECSRGNSRILLHVQPTPANRQEGELLSMQLATPTNPVIDFSITRGDETASVVTCISKGGASLQHRVAHLPAPGDAQLLCGELEVLCHDRVFEEALQVAATIAERAS